MKCSRQKIHEFFLILSQSEENMDVGSIFHEEIKFLNSKIFFIKIFIIFVKSKTFWGRLFFDFLFLKESKGMRCFS